MSSSLSVVIPAYNEATALDSALSKLIEHLSSDEKSELIVVDDGSTDGSRSLLSAVSWPRLRVISHPRNRGKGAAVRTGMLAATGEIRVFSDADLAYGIAGIDQIVDVLRGGADGAVGVRESRGRWGMHPARAAASRVFSAIVREVAIAGYEDTQCGLKGFTAAAATNLFEHSTIDGFGFDVEILCLARLFGYEISQVPVASVNRRAGRSSTVRLLPATLQMLRDVLRIRRSLRKGAYGQLPGREVSPAG